MKWPAGAFCFAFCKWNFQNISQNFNFNTIRQIGKMFKILMKKYLSFKHQNPNLHIKNRKFKQFRFLFDFYHFHPNNSLLILTKFDFHIVLLSSLNSLHVHIDFIPYSTWQSSEKEKQIKHWKNTLLLNRWREEEKKFKSKKVTEIVLNFSLPLILLLSSSF